MGLIVDTGVLIRAERLNLQDPVAGSPKGTELGISTVTASELLEGSHRADSLVRKHKRETFIKGIFGSARIVAFTLEIAQVHARLRADLRRRGLPIGAHDLIIAATAVHLGWSVMTTNPGEFARIEGHKVLAV